MNEFAIEMLRTAQQEIVAEGHLGWGNAIQLGIEALSAQPAPDAAQVSNPFHPNSFEHAYWQQGWDARDRAPQPVQGVAESVADGKDYFEALLESIRYHAYEDGEKRLTSNSEETLRYMENARTFFKQSRQSPRAQEAFSRELLQYALAAVMAAANRAEPGNVGHTYAAQIASALSHSSKGDEHGK